MNQKSILKINQEVKLEMTEERGRVIGIAAYAESPNQYFVRYKAADGRQVQDWFSFEALVSEDGDSDDMG